MHRPSRLPLLSYRSNPEGFYSLKNFAEAEFPASADALWTEHETLLFCTFRLADFAKGCFAPKRKWFSLVGFILLWLTGERHDLSFLDAYYAEAAYSTVPCEGTDLEFAQTVERAMDWHEKGGFLLPPDGTCCRAVLEGVGAAVLPDGTHSALHNYTTVSTGETALAYYLKSLYTWRRGRAPHQRRAARIGAAAHRRRGGRDRRLGPQRRQRMVERLLSGRRRARAALPAAAARALRRRAARRGRRPPQSGLPAAHHRPRRAARRAHRAGGRQTAAHPDL